jgi:uncharacterized protein YPO0396
MRNQMNLTSAIAMAAAKDAGNAPAPEAKKAEPIQLAPITKTNVAQTAKAIWSQIQGEKFADKADVLQEVMTALRKERDADDTKVTRPRKELEVILKEAIGKPMGELQAVKVPLMDVPINIPTLVKIACSVPEEGKPDHPLKKQAVEFMRANKLSVKREKKGSRGRETTTLIEGDITKLAA